MTYDMDAVRKSALDFVECIKAATDWTPVPESCWESRYCGTYLSINPSGKYYMPWSSNQTFQDVQADDLFWEAVDDMVPDYVFMCGEDDPVDCFCYRDSTMGVGDEFKAVTQG
jgi:hypothetical protein